MTSGAALAGAAEVLGTRLDAELLLAHVLDMTRAGVVARDERVLTPEEQGDFEQLLARRLSGEPLAYLTGTKEFWSLELEVTRDVLVPRPETELLVEWALSCLRKQASSVLDIGTGSGAIALSLAKEMPEARVLASDVSAAALAVARRNAASIGLGNLQFVESNLFERLDSRFRGNDGFDLIVSNPPYVAEGDPHLADLKFEPAVALASGRDGLDALREIVAGAPHHLRPGGWLLVEHGTAQGAAVRGLFARAGFASIETRRDLAGHERATGGQRP
ncbi:MAG: peptide chain release factor N(5)-glutamine methyltransferase [Gammaproteobacteria bacterium]